jgi:predicted transposase YbfD/YdcC
LPLNAKKVARTARAHWGIESSLLWVLDAVFGEDQCRKRYMNATFNFAILRKMALSLLQSEKSQKESIKGKQRDACFYEDYLLKILGIV